MRRQVCSCKAAGIVKFNKLNGKIALGRWDSFKSLFVYKLLVEWGFQICVPWLSTTLEL